MEQTKTKHAWLKRYIEAHRVEWTIRKIIEQETNRNRVTAIAMPAGTGKSSYIKKLIADGDDGLIVVTDRIKQVKSYFTFTDENGDSSDVDTSHAIYLTADNLSETIPQINRKPIIVMTMARYFSLSVDEIIALSHWENGTRNKIIIDEMPPLIEQEQITMKDLNDVHSALYESIDDTANQTEKDWAIHQWKKFRDKIETQMDKLEKTYSENHDQFYCWFDLEGDITDDNDRFFSFINANEKKLIKYGAKKNVDIMGNINHVQQLRDFGGMYSCRLKKSGEYVKSITVTINNLHRLIHLMDENGDGLKVYILDGTADLSPDYRQYGIDIIECSAYYRDISNLTINIIDINTSKNALNNYKANSEEITEIKKQIQPNSLVISYMDYVDIFADCVENPTKQLAHFGAIRGDNDYNHMRNVVQIGLNRFPPIYYLLLHRELYKDYYDCMFDKPVSEYIEELDRIIKNHCLKSDDEANKQAAKEIAHIMEMSLLADIEQNIFRTAIRTYNDNQPIVCTLVFNIKQHTELINQMRKRFETHGAKVIIHSKPQSLKLKAAQRRKPPKGKEQTNAQKILAYLDGLKKDTTFKVSDILDATGMNRKQYERTIEKNKILHEMMQAIALPDKRGFYRKIN